MKIIADSGSTKSDWVLIDGSGIKMSFQLVGMNPFYIDSNAIVQILTKDLLPFVNVKQIREVYFYGSGCSSISKALIVEEALHKIFKSSAISVESDLLGAARALFGNESGLACILGTGSNSCLYDGSKIVRTIPSLGYFFADEGSGAHMGKTFIKDYLMGRLPKKIESAFKKEFNYSRDNILDAIYNLPFPNRFLASFCDFYSDHMSDKYIHQLITNSFREFFISHIEQYPDYRKLQISVVGSVAFYFDTILRQVGNEFGVNIDKILRTPIEALANFHRK